MGKGKAIEMEDVKFHQCVKLSRFENDRTISFIPPDGAFVILIVGVLVVIAGPLMGRYRK